jgi:hypothetical protein
LWLFTDAQSGSHCTTASPIPPYSNCHTIQPPSDVTIPPFSSVGSAFSLVQIRSEVHFCPQHGILTCSCALYQSDNSTPRIPESMEILKGPINPTMTRPTAPPVTSPPRFPPETAYEGTPITSQRSLRQLSIFFLGGACLLASTAITRKAVWRRQLRTKPKFYEPNTNPHEFFSPFHDAIQALNLATMNCTSVGIMAVGGIMWTFDIANLREAQTALRGRLNYDSIYKSEDDIPRNFSELIAASGEMRIEYEEQNGSNDKSQ